MQKEFPILKILPLFLLCFFSCKASDLRPSEVLDKKPTEVEIQEGKHSMDNLIQFLVLGKKVPNFVQIVCVDKWNSRLLRTLSSLPENQMKLSIVLEWESTDPNTTVTFLAGSFQGKTYRLRGEELTLISQSKTEVVTDNSLKIYIQSLDLYLRLPFQVSNNDFIATLPPKKIQETEYNRIYSSRGGWKIDPNQNQYILYLNKSETQSSKWNNLTQLFVQFTYREFFSSYQGLLIYNKFETSDVLGMRFPRSIGIWDDFGAKESVHELQIESLLLPSIPKPKS